VAGVFAAGALVAGVGLLVFGGPAWVHGLGALSALACAVIVFGLAAGPPGEPAAGPPGESAGGPTAGPPERT
jgi:hypothetical protein